MRAASSGMATIISLLPGEQMPDLSEDKSWLLVEASGDGRFFGTGAAWKVNGECVCYASLAENDGSLDSALAAAERWAAKYNVPSIWLQATA